MELSLFLIDCFLVCAFRDCPYVLYFPFVLFLAELELVLPIGDLLFVGTDMLLEPLVKMALEKLLRIIVVPIEKLNTTYTPRALSRR